jgi:hypothetical protein
MKVLAAELQIVYLLTHRVIGTHRHIEFKHYVPMYPYHPMC